MINFREIYYKNLLSIGNNGVTINLQSHPKTLISGLNGNGKSTLIDAVNFVLFGKGFRNIKKPQLINSTNEKNMLVELSFNVGNHQFFVRRGMKPNVFEIYKDDELIDQEASVKDYQKTLEQIIGMSEKTFHQIVILGSSSYVPFMKLPAGDRRAVIENLIDIQVFSYMNSVVKQKVSEISDTCKEVSHDISLRRNSYELKKEHLEQIQGNIDESIVKDQQKIASLREENEENDKILDKLSNELNSIDLSEKEKLESKSKNLSEKIAQIEHSIKDKNKTIQFLTTNEECPSCGQSLENTSIENELEDIKEKVSSFESTLEMARVKYNEISEKLNEIYSMEQETRKMEEEYKDIERKKNSNDEYIKRLEENIETVRNQSNEQEEQQDLQKLENEIEELKNKEEQHKQDLLYYSKIVEMLKDGGIKQQIIRNYIPILNSLIAEYLDIIEFNVEFQFDEEFNEYIRSRGRDEFSYSQLSEGEALRIDIILLFAFRELARIKNSATTNLLIIDEIGGSSLDSEGLQSFSTILNEFGEKGNNIFFIGHNIDSFKETFDRSLTFQKNLHTQIKEEQL